MRRVSLVMLLMLVALAGFAQENDRKQYQAFGVAFYNLENLFDTINNNGKYDLEFSPAGARQWNGAKYRSKINRLATAIAAMTTQTTPMGPAVIGVSEIENKSVLDDLVRAEPIRKWRLQVVHHDSPDRRGVDVGLLYNPRMFRPINVTNHRLTIPGNDSFRTRDQMCVCGVMGGDTIAVIVNHWPSRLGGQERSSYLREAAADLSHSIADSLWRINPNIGVIVMGDLNDDPMDLLGGPQSRRPQGGEGCGAPRILQSLVEETRRGGGDTGLRQLVEPLRPDHRVGQSAQAQQSRGTALLEVSGQQL